jgi:hypothetical protein
MDDEHAITAHSERDEVVSNLFRETHERVQRFL